MAVPKERVVARLKAFAGRANLSNTRIDELSARLCSLPADDADDAAIDAVITNADAMFPFKDIASQDDKIIGLENKLKVPNPNNPESPTPPSPTTPPAPANDAPEWAKALIKQNETLAADITALKTGKVIETKKSAATQAFEKSEVLKALNTPELKQAWLNRVNVESETSIEDQILGLETEYTSMQQTFANSIGYSGTPPINGRNEVKPDESLIQSVVDSL